MSRIVDEVLALYEGELASARYDEVVTEREHALQAADLAEAEGADGATVAAALLHDVGRLLIAVDPGFVAADRAHDRVGERWLAERFVPAVSEPVGLHVAAKRYLCGTEPDYLDRLSAVSIRSLEVQGGPMGAEEAAAFRTRPGWEAGIRLRRWDDRAKEVGRPTRSVADHRPLLETLVLGLHAG